MRKQLSITLALVFAVACKTDPASSTAPSGETGAPPSKVRSGKIDVKPVQPALPASDDDRFDAKPDRGDWHKRRDAKLDTNGDGVVSDDERAAAMKQRVTAMHERLDTDGDGKLTPAELANAPGRMHFDDPAALDTNHDGDISADELAAGLKAKRDARRAARNGGGDPAPAPAAGSSTTP